MGNDVNSEEYMRGIYVRNICDRGLLRYKQISK
jgi:hypothetical protein